MALAALCSPLHGGARGYGTCRTSEVSCLRQDFFSSKCDLSVKNLIPMRCPPMRSAAIRSSSESASSGFHGRYWRAQSGASSCSENNATVERLLEGSVDEILFNIEEAPFLQYVFDSNGRVDRSQRQKIPKELLRNSDNWMKSSLRESLSKADPDGVILVEQLEADFRSRASQSGNEEKETVSRLYTAGGETCLWGLLVQARDAHDNACYLMETTRVLSTIGIVTHYCLTRAQCFGPSPREQMMNVWLS